MVGYSKELTKVPLKLSPNMVAETNSSTILLIVKPCFEMSFGLIFVKRYTEATVKKACKRQKNIS